MSKLTDKGGFPPLTLVEPVSGIVDNPIGLENVEKVDIMDMIFPKQEDVQFKIPNIQALDFSKAHTFEDLREILHSIMIVEVNLDEYPNLSKYVS